MHIGGLGWPELVIILVVVLIIFGPKNLPKLGKAIGNGIKSLRRGVESGKEKIDEKFDAVEGEKAEAERSEAAAEPVVENESRDDGPSDEAPQQEGSVKVKRVVKRTSSEGEYEDGE